MGILDRVVPPRKVSQPTYVANDFPGGLELLEFQDGKPLEKDKVVLLGSFMPQVPFSFGGEQRLITEYYPGNSEPTVQVFGPKEDQVTIRGKFKLKKLNANNAAIKNQSDLSDLRQAALEYQELVDAMRIRGNLIRITLGEWRRYGFIEKTKFDLKMVTDIAYEITFMIVGFNPPTNHKILRTTDSNIIAPNKALTDKAAEALAAARTMPTEMPQSIGDFLNDQIDTVAGAVATVTGFVDSILSDAEALNRSAQRALGLIKYARATISQTVRRVNTLSMSVGNLGADFKSAALQTSATILNANHIHKTRAQFYSLSSLLASLQKQFEALRKTVPMIRHLVRDGDTLQKIALKYYNNADNWQQIYSHNKLRTTELTVGSVLEIPKI